MEGGKEDKENWTGFLRHLKGRGLKGVRLVVSDKCLGLVESLVVQEIFRTIFIGIPDWVSATDARRYPFRLVGGLPPLDVASTKRNRERQAGVQGAGNEALWSPHGCGEIFRRMPLPQPAPYLALLESRLFYVLSRLSFGMYLNHFYLLKPVTRFGLDRLPLADSMPVVHHTLGFVLFVATSAGVAVLTFALIDSPFLRLREWIYCDRRVTAPAVGVSPVAPQPT